MKCLVRDRFQVEHVVPDQLLQTVRQTLTVMNGEGHSMSGRPQRAPARRLCTPTNHTWTGTSGYTGPLGPP